MLTFALDLIVLSLLVVESQGKISGNNDDPRAGLACRASRAVHAANKRASDPIVTREWWVYVVRSHCTRERLIFQKERRKTPDSDEENRAVEVERKRRIRKTLLTVITTDGLSVCHPLTNVRRPSKSPSFLIFFFHCVPVEKSQNFACESSSASMALPFDVYVLR